MILLISYYEIYSKIEDSKLHAKYRKEVVSPCPFTAVTETRLWDLYRLLVSS